MCGRACVLVSAVVFTCLRVSAFACAPMPDLQSGALCRLAMILFPTTYGIQLLIMYGEVEAEVS